MKTYILVGYTVAGSVPKMGVVELDTTREYIEEYKLDAHKLLSEKFGVDSKLIKIIDWKYLGHDFMLIK